MTFQKHLFQISQSWTHTRNALAEFNEALLNQLFAEAGSEQPRQQMSEVPTVEGELLDVVALEHTTQIIRDELVRNGFSRR